MNCSIKESTKKTITFHYLYYKLKISIQSRVMKKLPNLEFEKELKTSHTHNVHHLYEKKMKCVKNFSYAKMLVEGRDILN